MSLKAVHFFFILVSIAFSAYFATWCLGSFSWDTEPSFVVLGYLSAFSTVALVPYLVWFLRKTKDYSLLSWVGLLALGISETAAACPVCVGDPNSPLTKSVNAGVEALLYVVFVILALFASLFIFWARRAGRLEASR